MAAPGEDKNITGPSGDGTDGKDTDEIISLIKKCRRVLKMKADYGQFQYGDLVYDEKNNEHGIIIGEKPDIATIDEQLGILQSSRRTKTYLVLTITEDDSIDEGKKTRIRYTNSRYLRSIPDSLEDNSITDLELFCSKQCIMECSEDCILKKYKTKR